MSEELIENPELWPKLDSAARVELLGEMRALIDAPQRVEKAEQPDIQIVHRGREAVKIITLPVLAEVAIRAYRRGGWLAKINRDIYLTSVISRINSRAERECRVLMRLREAGVSVPEVVCGLVCYGPRRFYYRAALATKFISGAENLLNLWKQKSLSEAELGLSARKAGEECRKCLELGVEHRDLHLGNVLYGPAGKISILDFDGAREVSKEEIPQAIERLRERWTRSIRKHEAPQSMVQGFVLGLETA